MIYEFWIENLYIPIEVSCSPDFDKYVPLQKQRWIPFTILKVECKRIEVEHFRKVNSQNTIDAI